MDVENGGERDGGQAGGGADARRRHTRSVALLLLTGLLWSLGGVFIKTTPADPFAISTVRSLTAAAALFVILRGRPRFTFSRAQIIGALAYAATVTCFVNANKLTTAANAILLQYCSPIFVAIFNWLLLKEALRWYDYISMAGVGGGLVLLMYGSIDAGSTLGNIIALVSGLAFAGVMMSLRLHRGGSRVETIILGNLIAAAVGLPFLITHGIPLGALPPVMFLGVFQIAIPYVLLAKASEHASALDLALIPVVEPLLNPVWVFLVTGERPAPVTFLGGAILLAIVTFRSLIIIKK